MRKILLIFLFSGLLLNFSSCCKKSEEAGRYELSDFERSFIPYEKDQTVIFQNSENSEKLKFDVLTSFEKTARTVTENCDDDYYVYEYKVVELFHTIPPKTYLALQVMPVDYNPNMIITVNNTYFKLNIANASPDLDTVIINDVVYTDVYKISNDKTNGGEVVPNEIFYNKENGILQINFSDSTSYKLFQ